MAVPTATTIAGIKTVIAITTITTATITLLKLIQPNLTSIILLNL